MPKYVEPALPDPVENFVRIFGVNRARLALILTLSRGEATAAELMRETGVSVHTINRHLRDLEQNDIVRASMNPADPRRRRAQLTWSLNTAKVRAELKEILNSLPEQQGS